MHTLFFPIHLFVNYLCDNNIFAYLISSIVNEHIWINNLENYSIVYLYSSLFMHSVYQIKWLFLQRTFESIITLYIYQLFPNILFEGLEGRSWYDLLDIKSILSEVIFSLLFFFFVQSLNT